MADKAAKTFGCITCGRTGLPRDRFPMGRTGKRMSPVCWECQHNEALEMDARRTARLAAAVTKVIDGVTWHRCSSPMHEGDPWLPWTQENFYVSYRNPDGSVRKLSWRCKVCDSRRQTEYDRRMRRADPETAAAYREMRNASQRSWRRHNPEKCRYYQRRWKQRLRRDPERFAAFLADQRITYRLRRETQGLPVRAHGQKTAIGAWKVGAGHSKDAYDVEPLALWLDSVLAGDGRDPGELAEVMQVDHRVLSRIHGREYRTVTLSVADHLVWGYGKSVRLDGAEIERALERRCREMPGNGERILRYIDLIERVAHLDGAVVDRVEDLWPELA